MTRDEAQTLVAQHGGNVAAAARAAGIPRQTLCDRLKGKPEGTARTGAAVGNHRRIVSESELLLDTDSETKIQTAIREQLKALKEGEYLRDSDMRREVHCGDLETYREVRASEEFAGNVMDVGRYSDPVTYWGREASVASMIERGKARKPKWR